MLLISTVKIFIGICNPMAPPNTLKKNKNKTPIVSRITPDPIRRADLAGVRKIKNNPRITNIPTRIIIGSMFTSAPFFPLLVFMNKRIKIEPKKHGCTSKH